MLNIDEIQNGIVIDHIKAGTAIGLMDLLGIKGNRTASVALIQNARSNKSESGRKDIIKVEGDSSWLNLDVLGCVFLGIKAMGWTLYSSFMLSFYSSMCEKLFPMSQPLTDDTLLELCFAVALPALASGIVFNIGASTGGTEIVAMILHKYIKVEIGRALLLSDIGTVLFAACIYGPQTGMYCVLGLIGRSTIVDTAIESLNLRKVCTVITSRPEPIRRFVTETLGRTATQQDATGVYTGEPRTMIMVALTRRQAGLLRDFLRREDPEAFLTIVNSSEIIGKGFQSV